MCAKLNSIEYVNVTFITLCYCMLKTHLKE